jgi:hypothetical protein
MAQAGVASARGRRARAGRERRKNSALSILQSRGIVQFQRNFYRKERKERRDKDLWCFFFAICVFFVVNSSSVAAGRAVFSCSNQFALSVSIRGQMPFPWLSSDRNLGDREPLPACLISLGEHVTP